MAKATSLLKAYVNETVPMDGGFIVSGLFEAGTIYAIYEITAYKNVKEIFKTPEGLIFRTDGNRAHVLVEPPTYAKRFLDPVNRDQGKSIPYRFNELHVITGQRQEKVMVGKEPITLHSTFTIMDKGADYFAFVFHPTEDVFIAMKRFLADSLYNDCQLSHHDAMASAETILGTVKKFTIWKS